MFPEEKRYYVNVLCCSDNLKKHFTFHEDGYIQSRLTLWMHNKDGFPFLACVE